MRNIIVGTAGHIDHGKTALVKALTGTDADRLAEEKRRGITIDLGFAHLALTPDIRLGFIDVPGHERFVRNMMAGAAGIDVVLFVVSAAESIKPQTREHFEICRLLGVQTGIVALTKADLVDPEILELVRLEVDEFTAGSFLENAPRVAVSSVTGEGLPELRRALETAARAAREKAVSGWFRLPIDRAFTMRGHGTVVTGTMVSGTIRREDEVELFPPGRRLRVRGLHVYGQPTDRARAGERTAINLADIEPAELHRGMVLTEPGHFSAVTKLDCRLDLLSSAKPLKNGAPVHFHAGAAEIEAEVRFHDRRTALQPGNSAGARIVLRDPALILPGDRFVIRMFSPVVTIGGGVVMDISGNRHNTPKAHVLQSRWGITDKQFIAWTGLKTIPASPDVEAFAGYRIGKARLAEIRQELTAATRAFHKANSLLPGIRKADLKGNEIPAEVFEYALAGASELVQEGEIVRLKTHRVVLKFDEEQARAAMESAFEQAGLAAPSVADVLKASGVEPARARSLLQILLREGKLMRVSDDLVLHAPALANLREQISARRGERFTVSMFKDWTGVSRKYAIPILEYFDRERITMREGEVRVILKSQLDPKINK